MSLKVSLPITAVTWVEYYSHDYANICQNYNEKYSSLKIHHYEEQDCELYNIEICIENLIKKNILLDAGCLLELKNFKNVFNKDCHDMVRRMMSDTIKDDNPEWPLNRYGHHSNAFQSTYKKYYRRMRYAGYRATIYFLYGKLGKRKWIQVPSCVGEKI